MEHEGLNRLVCAALVNERFCQTLLRNPAQAVAGGYSGHNFALSADEHDLVLGIRALHLEDFAAQVHRWISSNGRDCVSGLRWNPLSSSEPMINRVLVPVSA